MKNLYIDKLKVYFYQNASNVNLYAEKRTLIGIIQTTEVQLQ